MKKTLSVVIHTQNEEKNIEECITSALLLTDDIIIIDMQSTDRTVELAKKLNASVRTFPPSLYVEPAREFGIQESKGDWIFILDADERMTKELAEEIHSQIILENYTYFRVSRKNLFGRKYFLKHGGWWPDYQIRLVDKIHFKNWPKEIHSTPVIEGKEGYLNEPILHYFHGDFETMVKKTIIFEDIESSLLFNAGRGVSTSTFFRKFLGELSRRIFWKMGFLDGKIGIIESIYQAFSKTVTYLYLYEKKHSSL